MHDKSPIVKELLTCEGQWVTLAGSNLYESDLWPEGYWPGLEHISPGQATALPQAPRVDRSINYKKTEW